MDIRSESNVTIYLLHNIGSSFVISDFQLYFMENKNNCNDWPIRLSSVGMRTLLDATVGKNYFKDRSRENTAFGSHRKLV